MRAQAAREEADRRRPLEECIKRPYFHVKALDALQLTAWSRLLDYTEGLGDAEATQHAYERCLVATALYPGERRSRKKRCLVKSPAWLAWSCTACATAA